MAHPGRYAVHRVREVNEHRGEHWEIYCTGCDEVFRAVDLSDAITAYGDHRTDPENLPCLHSAFIYVNEHVVCPKCKEDRCRPSYHESLKLHPIIVSCPRCNTQHIDRDGWETEAKRHRKHLCANCGHVWNPFDENDPRHKLYTIGVSASVSAKYLAG